MTTTPVECDGAVDAPSRSVPADHLERQIRLILSGWGLSAPHSEAAARILTEADLAGIDSHGAAVLDFYRTQIANGRIALKARPAVIVDSGAMAVLDGDGGFGHLVSLRAVDLVARKAAALGVAAVAVRNSHHFGAAGPYVRRIAERGMVGLCTTAVWRPALVPTGGRAPMLGTNPIAFAAPARRNRPFLLDMATATAAIGKMRVRKYAGQALPSGWCQDAKGRWEHDPDRALAEPRLTPLGGDEAHGGHKGYGLATMVEVLATVLAGASFAPLRPDAQPRHDVGHFFLALDPALFRPDGGFAADLDALIDALRASPPLEDGRPVQVAGDPEYRSEQHRRVHGIPLSAGLLARLQDWASEAGAPFLLAEPSEPITKDDNGRTAP